MSERRRYPQGNRRGNTVGEQGLARGVPPGSRGGPAVSPGGPRSSNATNTDCNRPSPCTLRWTSQRAALFAARMTRPVSVRSPMVVSWRERPPFWTAWPAKPAASEVVAHATLSLPQPERVVVGRMRPGGIERVRIRVVNSGRRAVIVRLATRALKALRASSVPLRPRCARLTALTARAATRSRATIDGRTEVLDDGRRRRYCRIIFAGCSSQPPPHRPMWSTFESAVSGHGSFPTSQATSWLSVRATSRPRNR